MHVCAQIMQQLMGFMVKVQLEDAKHESDEDDDDDDGDEDDDEVAGAAVWLQPL